MEHLCCSPARAAAADILPVKKAVRTTEGLLEGETVALAIELADVA